MHLYKDSIYSYSKDKFYGPGLSINGEDLKTDSDFETDVISGFLEGSLNAGKKFKAKQIRKLLKNKNIADEKFRVQDLDLSYKVEGPGIPKESGYFGKSEYPSEKINKFVQILQKAFDAGKEEQAKEIIRALER